MSGHYFDTEPAVPSRRQRVPVALPDRTFELETDRGIFSAGGLDAGTKFLLSEGPTWSGPPPGDATTSGTPAEGAPGPDAPALVDVGCGYGPIAVTLALRHPDTQVWAVDVNRRARELCAANANRLGLTNLVVVEPTAVPPDLPVAAIWSNPPVRIGKAALHALLDDWLGRLDTDGFAALVVHRNLGGDSLARWLRGRDWEVERLGSRQGYRLLRVARAVEAHR